MSELKNVLQYEQQRLKNIQAKLSESLEQAPDGKVRLSMCKNTAQYYHCLANEKKNGIYISKSNVDLIKKLAQKFYDEKVKKLVDRRINQIGRILCDYEEDEIEKLYLTQHEGIKKYVDPVEIPWEQQLEEWIAEEYISKMTTDDMPMILTERGEYVRSKSEKILADYFYRNNIPYKYEKPLYLQGYGKVYPDFTFLSPKTREEIYWEHHGRMDDPKYAESAIRKIQTYETNNIYPGERLILTFETEKNLLDDRIVKSLTQKYLM